MKKEKTNITKKIFYLFLIVLIVVIGFITITYLLKDSSSKEQHELKIYGNKNGYICLDGETLCDTVVFTIPTDSNDSKILAVSEYQSFILFKDTSLKVYNIETKEITELKLDNKYDEYKLVTDIKDTLLVGIIYKKDNITGYYNIKKDQKLYENKNYDELYPINENYIGAYKNEDESYLLSTDSDKIVTSSIGECLNYNVVDDFVIIEKGCLGEPSITVLSTNFDIIANNIYSNEYSIYNNELHVIENNELVTYNKEGTITSTDKNYGEIFEVVDNYLIALNSNNELIVTDGNNLRIVVTPWNERYYYNWNFTEYKDDTITFVVQEGNDEESMDASGMKYRVNIKTKEVNSAKIEYLYQN